MKWLKYFEDKMNNREGSLITRDDIIDCIKRGGVIYTSSVIDYDGNDRHVSMKPLSVDNDDIVTVDIDGIEYQVRIENIIRISYE